jgi:hypothetical protein
MELQRRIKPTTSIQFNPLKNHKIDYYLAAHTVQLYTALFYIKSMEHNLYCTFGLVLREQGTQCVVETISQHYNSIRSFDYAIVHELFMVLLYIVISVLALLTQDGVREK